MAACLLWMWFVVPQLRGLCGRTRYPYLQSRVVSPVPMFSAAPTTVDDDAFLDCSHDDILGHNIIFLSTVYSCFIF